MSAPPSPKHLSMTRIQRRLLIDTSIIGVALTLLVAVLDYSTRIFMPLDNWFYDRRARLCQVWTPPPTDKLVHVDIDDASLTAIGKWPWPRTHIAELVDEIDRAGAKAIAMDIIFVEPSKLELEELPGGKIRYIDHDTNLANAVARGGKSMVPVSLTITPTPGPVFQALRRYLLEDLELTEAQCAQRLANDPGVPKVPQFPMDVFLGARRDAMNARIEQLLEKEDLSFGDLKRRLLPKTDPSISGSPQINTLSDEMRKVQAALPLRRFMREIPPGLPALPRFGSEQAPIPALSRATAYSGFVNYLQDDEGEVIRSLPMWASYRGKLFPQMDLVVACQVLGVKVEDVQLKRDRVIIPRPPGYARDIVIPVREKYSETFGEKIGMSMDIPVRGKSSWETIYDHGRYEKPEMHVPMSFIWEVRTIRERMARNNGMIDRALSVLLDDDAPNKLALDPSKAKRYEKNRPGAEEVAPRRVLADWTRTELKNSPIWGLVEMKESELKPEEKVQRDEMLAADKALATLVNQNTKFEQILAERRAILAEKIRGRAVYMGWAATANLDRFPTAAQPNCPGVVIHGMVFNAIMTGEFWWHAPRWVTLLVTIFIGTLVTLATGFLKPAGALLVSIVLGGLYLLVNGLWLFDYGNTCVGVAGPMVALGSVWSTGALAGFLIEAAERARITKRFSSYVDQKLVDYVIEHPDVILDGQMKEMSVVFTDLAGFTTLSERLRERTVPILSEYLGVMVPIIRRNNGLVNKFLGDGIMCFFGAPKDDPEHAVNAVRTCLEMQAAMRSFALKLMEQGLPLLEMRCGVSSGNMVVGDSGPAEASDYTVLGDTVNFASRLEGANKVTGTHILISERTSELVSSKFLVRPVGRLQVVGKSEGLMTYEPLASVDDASLEDRLNVAMFAEMAAAFAARDFAKCIEVADRIEQEGSASKLASLYRRTSREYLINPPEGEFTGSFVLTEK